MTKQLTYWILIILYSYIPTIGVHYLIRPYWFEKGSDHTSTTSFELFFTMILLPVYLVAGHFILSKKYRTERYFAVNALLILSSIAISAYLHFLNWADSVGNRSNPDAGTRAVMTFEVTTGSIIAMIGIALAYYRHYKKSQLMG